MIVSRRPRRIRLVHIAAVPTAFVLSAVTTLAWAWTGGVEQIGLPYGPAGDPTISVPVLAPGLPAFALPGLPHGAYQAQATHPGPGAAPAADDPSVSALTSAAGRRADPATDLADPALPGWTAPGLGALGFTAPAGVPHRGSSCHTGAKLVPTCGILWGVAPGAHTESRGASALAAFERKTGRRQAVYHAYHGGIRQLFPTPQEIAIAHQPGAPRILFLNWKPEAASWAAIARGDRRTDAFLDRLAVHIRKTFPDQFFFAVHHEGENDVRREPDRATPHATTRRCSGTW